MKRLATAAAIAATLNLIVTVACLSQFAARLTTWGDSLDRIDQTLARIETLAERLSRTRHEGATHARSSRPDRPAEAYAAGLLGSDAR